MRLPHQTAYVFFVFISLICTPILEAKKSESYLCPIGFKLAHNKHSGNYLCYKRKEPETFENLFDDCDGNLYTSKLYRSLNIPKIDELDRVWADYKSVYPGGPFMTTSRSKSEEKVLNNVTYFTGFDVYQESCLTVNKFGQFTAVRCEEKYSRYCIVKPYPETENELSTSGCDEFGQYWRFTGPRQICLSNVTGHGGGPVRATWNQSQALCTKNGGSLLSRGWQYANFPLFHKSGVLPSPIYPLGMIWDHEREMLQFISEEKLVERPFNVTSISYDTNETLYMAIKNETWVPVNSSFIFYDVICEHAVRPRNVFMKLSVESDKLMLLVNNTLDKRNLYCYTNSETYYPTKVKLHEKKKNDSNYDVYRLSADYDGYYWCIHVDPDSLRETESEKILFLHNETRLADLYAVKIRVDNEYSFEDDEDIKEHWEDELEKLIYYRTKYVQMYGAEGLNDTNITNVLEDFRNSQPYSSDDEVISKINIKRMYMDKRTILFHVQVREDMIPVDPAKIRNGEVLYMKPVYYCRSYDSAPPMSINNSKSISGCRTYKCVGDFDEGASLVEEATPDCFIRGSVLKTERINVEFNEPTPIMPTIIVSNTPTSTTNQNQHHLLDQGSDSSEENSDSHFNEELVMMPNSTHPPISTDKTTTKNTKETTMTTDETSSEEISTVTATEESTIIDTPSVTTVNTPIDVVSTVNTPTEELTTSRRPIPPPFTTTPPTTTTTSTSLAPEEQLENVLHDLDLMLQNESLTITVEKIETTFDQVNDLLDIEDELEIPGTLLHMLDDLGTRINLNGSNTGRTVRNNIALLMADASPQHPIRGMKVAASNGNDDTFTEETFQFIADEIDSTHLLANKTEAVVYLPESVTKSSRRISFLLFRNERAFRTSVNVTAVNSKVISVNVENITTFGNGEVIDIHLSPLVEEPDGNTSRTCAYWQFLKNDTGYWSTDGCIFIKSTEPGTLDTCRCNHLTHFAEILVPRTKFSDRNENVLEILSLTGCFLSIFGIILIILTAIMFRSWRREFSNKIWLQLCIALFYIAICFIIVVFAKFDGYNIPCMLVGILLHYSVLASFCWMLVAAIISYRRLVLVFTREISHKLLRASAFSWGAPFAVVGILLSIEPHSYAGQFEEQYPSGSFCYPSGLGLWLAVYAPVTLMLLANWTLFVLIVRSVFASRRIQRHGDTNEALRCACVSCLLVFLFGLPWIFGLFAYNVVAAYFYTCTVTLQGFVLFIFIVVGNQKTRDLWLNKLKIKQTRKIPVTSSTYTNRSVGSGSRAGDRTITTMEANNLKPRSLASPDDDSKFS
ncbi:uncharacterized protein ACR2FA_004170 [Aphomia sociella]